MVDVVNGWASIALALVLSPHFLLANAQVIQQPSADEASETNSISEDEKNPSVAAKVEVDPVNADDQIANRIQDILDATAWFTGQRVEVDRGVVFLDGIADSDAHRKWAEQTAMRTADVVAVVNRISINDPPYWNIDPAWLSLKQLAREATAMLPLILIAIVIGVAAYFAATLSSRMTHWLTKNRVDSSLLRGVMGSVVAVLIFIVGVYIALRVSGLTRLAVTLLGGTGLVGLALGFAFRDIAENYLASILISLNHPFRVDDLIEVDGCCGHVRKVTIRGTVLSTFDGNQIQIPNSTVYKSKITNFSATPLSRFDFGVGIGYDDSIAEAQRVIMAILIKHAAIGKEPEPLVLVDSLGTSTVNLKCYYWSNHRQHSAIKVRSSLIRQVKQVLAEAGISLPDEAREVVFPKGVPVRMLRDDASAILAIDLTTDGKEDKHANTITHQPEPEASTGEGDLSSDQKAVNRATEDQGALQDEANLLT